MPVINDAVLGRAVETVCAASIAPLRRRSVPALVAVIFNLIPKAAAFAATHAERAAHARTDNANASVRIVVATLQAEIITRTVAAAAVIAAIHPIATGVYAEAAPMTMAPIPVIAERAAPTSTVMDNAGFRVLLEESLASVFALVGVAQTYKT
ncbi:hypothetical protein TI39_contig511g00009 [Zymoseptoria brevis]|uniref:Uncharacterized protein n=1 Tax=Zymoseptoria brevis TaxID=1047168 RepID=A0A0F4GJQ8_9PEZI|nr:hypothetical protein TI39_contig511g00009 [Zymoseptoria brevis]